MQLRAGLAQHLRLAGLRGVQLVVQAAMAAQRDARADLRRGRVDHPLQASRLQTAVRDDGLFQPAVGLGETLTLQVGVDPRECPIPDRRQVAP